MSEEKQMSTQNLHPVKDDRRPALGLGRLVMALYWVFGIVTTLLAAWVLVRSATLASSTPIGGKIVALLAGVIYILVAIGITHNGRRMRQMAWVGVIIEMVGPIITGLLELGVPDLGNSLFSPWAGFGVNYWYLPLLVPIVGIVWMWRSDPRRIVELAEGIDRASR